jgi:hypothetical protein
MTISKSKCVMKRVFLMQKEQVQNKKLSIILYFYARIALMQIFSCIDKTEAVRLY